MKSFFTGNPGQITIFINQEVFPGNMKIHLPNSAFLGNIDPFLKNFDDSEPAWLDITANKKWISIHPVVLSMVAALGTSLKTSNIHIEKLEARSKHYLERMGLFKILGKDSGIKIQRHEPAGRFIPLTRIKSSDELTRAITEMIPLLHLEPPKAEPIRYVISELVRNVLEHSFSTEGAILCAQYYKKSNTIRIGIADRGVGIKESINQSHFAPSHLEAIRLALMPGITGTTRREGGTEFNAGAGLFFIRSIAKVNRNFFLIYSGDAMYKLLKDRPGRKRITLHPDSYEDNHSRDDTLPFWQGTLVGIDISLDTTAEFKNLLELIDKTYTKSIRERKKKRYRRARFI